MSGVNRGEIVRWLGWMFVTLVVVVGPTGAWPAQARQANGEVAAKAAALEHEARQIETMLIAPCCWREQVSVHQSEAAEQVKQEVRAMLAAGLTRQQVLDRFVSGYGVRILAEPPDAGFGRVLHHAPWVVGLGSVVGLAFFVRHVTRRRTGNEQPDNEHPHSLAERTGPGDMAPAEDDLQQRLDDELRDLD